MADVTNGAAIWRGMTAAQARENGASVPDGVPDDAVLVVAEMDVKQGSASDFRIPSIRFSVQFAWRWMSRTRIASFHGNGTCS